MISEDLRRRIIAWNFEQQKGAPEIARLAGCSERTVYNILARYREYGLVTNPHAAAHPRGRPRVLDITILNFMSALLDANPTLYLDEIQDKLFEAHNIEVHISTISRSLRRLALSHKSLAKAALERNEHLRATWQGVNGDIPKDYIIWLDEASVDNHTNQRDSGWAGLGRACVRRATFIRGQRYSILPALTCDGIIALDIFEGSVNKEKFISFLEDLAPKITPYPGPRSVIILDNCAIHHDEDIRKIIVDECGAKLIYLPPYSPDYNPIEQAFSAIKAWLRRHEADATRPEVRPWLIQQAALNITSDDAEGWIQNCGYDA